MIKGHHFIGNQGTCQGSQAFFALQASTGETLPEAFTEALASEVDQALDLAENAFKTYRQCSDAQRADFLEAIAIAIEALGDELLERAHLETGLPLARLQGERARTMGQLRLFAQHLRRPNWRQEISESAIPDRQPLPKPSLKLSKLPLGPVVVFGASNFPLAFSVAGGDTVSALAAACPVVFKAHPGHPGTCDLVAQAILKAAQTSGMPEGVFSMLQGQSHALGKALVQHPKTKALAFTGSYQGGKALYDLAQVRPEPIPVFAEMGSINPVFFTEKRIQSQGPALALHTAQSITLGVGQFCTNPGLLLVPSSQASFLQEIAQQLDQIPLGTFLHKGIAQAYQHGLEQWKALGLRIWTQQALPAPALWSLPLSAIKDQPKALEEIFGPSSLALLYDTEQEVLDFIADLPGQLTATLQAEAEEQSRLAPIIEAFSYRVGRVLWNGFPTGVEVSDAMVHGGPFPATTWASSTSVGTLAIERFLRPVCWQGFE